MISHQDLDKAQLHQFLKSGKIMFGGNKNLKIYGLLTCKSGKRMLVKNRVFFESEKDARNHGYRPCGHCMRAAYKEWKESMS